MIRDTRNGTPVFSSCKESGVRCRVPYENVDEETHEPYLNVEVALPRCRVEGSETIVAFRQPSSPSLVAATSGAKARSPPEVHVCRRCECANACTACRRPTKNTEETHVLGLWRLLRFSMVVVLLVIGTVFTVSNFLRQSTHSTWRLREGAYDNTVAAVAAQSASNEQATGIGKKSGTGILAMSRKVAAKRDLFGRTVAKEVAAVQLARLNKCEASGVEGHGMHTWADGGRVRWPVAGG